MKVKELRPILEHLDGDIEVEFAIVSQQEAPKNQETHKNEFSDNYRTCGSYTFGHTKFITDPQGLSVGQSIIPKGSLAIFAKQISYRYATRTKRGQKVLSIGNESFVMRISSSKQSLILFV